MCRRRAARSQIRATGTGRASSGVAAALDLDPGTLSRAGAAAARKKPPAGADTSKHAQPRLIPEAGPDASAVPAVVAVPAVAQKESEARAAAALREADAAAGGAGREKGGATRKGTPPLGLSGPRLRALLSTVAPPVARRATTSPRRTIPSRPRSPPALCAGGGADGPPSAFPAPGRRCAGAGFAYAGTRGDGARPHVYDRSGAGRHQRPADRRPRHLRARTSHLASPGTRLLHRRRGAGAGHHGP